MKQMQHTYDHRPANDDNAGTRSIRRWTIGRGRFVADYLSHGQFVARHFVARQFVVYIKTFNV